MQPDCNCCPTLMILCANFHGKGAYWDRQEGRSRELTRKKHRRLECKQYSMFLTSCCLPIWIWPSCPSCKHEQYSLPNGSVIFLGSSNETEALSQSTFLREFLFLVVPSLHSVSLYYFKKSFFLFKREECYQVALPLSTKNSSRFLNT
jgi:hypothetical protein